MAAIDLRRAFNRRMGGAGIRRNVRGPQGGGGGESPWYPETIGETILMALDPQEAYVARDGSDRVSLVEDRVTGDTYEEASGPAQPLWIASDASHSRPTLRFDGTRRLSTQNATLAEALDGAAAYTMLTVTLRTSTAAVEALLSVTTPATLGDVIAERWNAGSTFRYLRSDTGGASAVSSSTVSGPTSPGVLCSVYDGPGIYQRWNGSDITGTYASPAAIARTPVATRVQIGGIHSNNAWTAMYTGDISMILVFAGKVALGKIEGVEAFLQSEFSGL